MEHPANLVVSSRYDGCTMVQPYIKCTNTYCFTYNSPDYSLSETSIPICREVLWAVSGCGRRR